MSPSPDVVYTPPGWPTAVFPPDAPRWEQTAIQWLLDQCPPEARSYPGLRSEPVVLAAWARWHVQGSLVGIRAALSQTRSDLAQYTTGQVVERAILLWQREEARLLRVQRAVSLVEDALRGTRFRPRL